MTSFDRYTGQLLSGNALIRQSIGDIITTPLGSRICRRNYGSLVPELIDQPLSARTRLLLYASTANAVAKWEPRVSLKTVNLTVDSSGKSALSMQYSLKNQPSSGSFSLSLGNA
ncbi:MAG: GPW/gp25 family protein [Zymomonas mobilis]|uniref:GPW/gp25 family protein n=1 Tax=Zymomonas mobilis TaxID=542 RepID=UPI0039E7B97C